METAVNEPSRFLMDKVAERDGVLLEVLESPAPQCLRARLLKIYSARKCLHGMRPGDVIDFVHAPSSWGNTALKVGETGFVFLTPIREKLYEDSWRGHMVVEDIDGVPHAIFPHLAATTDPASPSSRAVQDPKRPYARAIPLAELETYVLGLLAAGTRQ